MELKFDNILCYEAIGNMVTTHEESMETAIPEYCPDVARIIDTIGQLKIRSKAINEEHLTISGTVRVSVLYSSEESAGLRSLNLSVPFMCTVDDKRFARCESVRVDSRLLLVEAKPVHSRKISLRVIPEFHITGYARLTQPLCCDLAEPSEDLQMQKAKMSCQLLTQVVEKAFSFTDEMALDTAMEPIEDILLDQLTMQTPSVQAVGDKIVVKGEAALSVLYRGENQQLCRYETQIPYSQILEAADLNDTCTFEAQPQLTESDIRLIRSEGNSELGISLGISLLVYVFYPCEKEYLSDLYSTRYPTQIHAQQLTLPDSRPCMTVHEESMQRLEPGMRFANLTDCSCGSVSAASDDAGSVLRTTVHFKVLYLDEEGTPMCMERSFEVACKYGGEVSGDGITAVCRAATLQQTGNTLELHVTTDFTLPQMHLMSITPITAVDADQTAVDSGERRPSLILRRFRPDETMWEVAKQYQTTAGAIREANHLEEADALPADIMLLIPRVR